MAIFTEGGAIVSAHCLFLLSRDLFQFFERFDCNAGPLSWRPLMNPPREPQTLSTADASATQLATSLRHNGRVPCDPLRLPWFQR